MLERVARLDLALAAALTIAAGCAQFALSAALTNRRTNALSLLTGLDATTSLRVVLALNSSARMLLVYAILRGLALEPGDATVFKLCSG